MARQEGTLRLGSNIEPRVSAPLDARDVVATKADLTTEGNFPYAYVGMKTAVREEGKLYLLKALPVTDPANWTEVGSGIDTSVLEAEIEKKVEGYIETATESVAAGDDRVLVEGEIVTIKSSDGTTTYQGVVDATGAATIDVDGKPVTVSHDGTGLVISNPDSADIDAAGVDVTTETIHKIDSRLLPHGQAADTQDYLENALTVKEAQGKYKVGDVIAKDTPLAEIVANMLTKKNVPTLTGPSVSLAGSGNKLLESGATLAATLTVTFDRGSISPAYGTSGYRAGEATAYSINGGGEQAENTFSVTVDESNREFTATVKYAAGEQPKDDEGENYDEPLAAGQLTSSAVRYEFVDAIYSNAANINVIAKEALVSKSTGSKVFAFPAQTVSAPETFEIPASWNVIAVEVLNELSGKYEDCSSEFPTTTTSHPNAANVDVSYVKYTDNRGYDAGPRTIRVRWN